MQILVLEPARAVCVLIYLLDVDASAHLAGAVVRQRGVVALVVTQ